MNLPLPKLGTVKLSGEISEKFFKGFTHIALPIKAKETKAEPEIEIVLSKKIIKSIEEIFSISFIDEIKKNGGTVTGKAGEVIEIPVLQASGEVVRILLVGVGESSNSSLYLLCPFYLYLESEKWHKEPNSRDNSCRRFC